MCTTMFRSRSLVLASLTVSFAVGCGESDSPEAGGASGTPVGPVSGVVSGGGGGAPSNGDCAFDTRTLYTTDGGVAESITVGKYAYNYDASGAASADNPIDLTTIAKYTGENGPCSAGDCAFDTRTLYTTDGGVAESITVGKYAYNYDASGAASADNPIDLTTIAKYTGENGPCSAGDCAFDTRTLYTTDGGVAESITMGKYAYNYDASGAAAADNPIDLTTIAKYTGENGPCSAENCAFDSRTLYVTGGGISESVVIGGNAYNFNASGEPSGDNPVELSSVEKYTDVCSL